jgi:hypothetical protein
MRFCNRLLLAALPLLGSLPARYPCGTSPEPLRRYLASALPIRYRTKRSPFVATEPDTTRQALLRLSFRVLHHSIDIDSE